MAIRKLIQQRREDIGDKSQTKNGNWIAQNMALYSSNPIKTVLDDEVEVGLTYKNVETIKLDDQ